METGYIKLFRLLLEWEWYHDANTMRLFIHLLLKANFIDKKWQGIQIKRGQVLTSLDSLSKELHLSPQQIRTSISKLISTNEITNQSTSSNRLITVVSYDNYQQDNKQDNKQATNEQQTSNKRATTTNNDKKEKNDKNIIYSIEFETVWKEYPSVRREDKIKCYEYWKQIPEDKKDLFYGVTKNYISNNTKENYKYVKKSHRWFKDWETQVDIEKPIKREVKELW